jgi:hypothetical protein
VICNEQGVYSFYLSTIKYKLLIVASIACFQLNAQVQDAPEKKPPYDKKEEIIFKNKRYRIYNNYLTAGKGLLASTVQLSGQDAFSADYHFHVRRHYFQTGLLLSGEGISAANDAQIHACYGFREEGNWSNVALFGGPSLFTGVTGTPGVTDPKLYAGVGAYFDFQAVLKLKYDIGLGFDIFADLGTNRSIGGFKIIVFFSSAYRGLKANYNPHVRSENQR